MRLLPARRDAIRSHDGAEPGRHRRLRQAAGTAGAIPEFDSTGEVEVPAGRYQGAPTQRLLQPFNIGGDHMPKAVCHACGHVKKACARVNAVAGRLPVADEAMAGALDDHFPLCVWQTGSATPSELNLSEGPSNRALRLAAGVPGLQPPPALRLGRTPGHEGRCL